MEIVNNKIVINKTVYLKAEDVLNLLQDLFENVKDEYCDEAMSTLEINIDSILEEIEFNEGENF